MEFYTCVNRYGKNILYRGYDLNTGKRVTGKVPYSPTLYLPSQKESKYKSLDGVNVVPRRFDHIRDAMKFIDQHSEIENFKIYGNQNFVAQFIYDKFPQKIEFDQRLVNITSIDIEVATNDDGFPRPEEAKQPVTAITVKNANDSVYYVWGLKDYDPTKNTDHTIEYTKCDSEADLLIKFLDHWDSDAHSPDIITGWNTQLFDIPYMVNRIGRVLGTEMVNKLSPWRVVNQRTVMLMRKPREAYILTGIQQMDYLDLFKKFAYTYGEQENYRLDTVANSVLGERKLSYEEFSDLDDLYERDYQLFIDYNIRDVELVDRMEEKLGLITLAMTMAYRGGVNYGDTFGTTAIWDTIIYRYLMNRNIVVPPNEDTHKSNYEGAYVKDPQVGLHNWVTSFDLNSLYPSIIVQYNMSPETMIGDSNVDGVTVDRCLQSEISNSPGESLAANGARFRTDVRGVIPEIISSYYDERKVVKKAMLDKQKNNVGSTDPDAARDIGQLENEQMSIKILLNSLYGAMANKYFRYFSMRMADGITASGRMAIQWAERAVNQYMNKINETSDVDYIIAIDTDSLYVNMGSLVDKFNPSNPVDFIDSVCRDKIEGVISESYDQMYRQFGGYENRMEMSREVIADRGIWTAKKRYILNVHDNEGVRYADPKLKIMGIEAIKSSTPSVCRTGLKELFKVIISGSEEKSQEAVQTFKSHFKTLPPEDVSFPRSISDIDKWADPVTVHQLGTPIHVRGALVYNKWVDGYGNGHKYQKITGGDKVKFTYLKTPNPVRSNVISYPAYLPPEMGVHKYIDYDKQFEKSFVGPIRPIFDAIGWDIEKQNTLEDLMG